jgi:hypothetical protein
MTSTDWPGLAALKFGVRAGGVGFGRRSFLYVPLRGKLGASVFGQGKTGWQDVNTFLIEVRGVDLKFKATYYKPLGRPNRQCRSSQGSVGFGRRPFTKCR